MSVNINVKPKVYGPIIDKLTYVHKENDGNNRAYILEMLRELEEEGYCYESKAYHHRKRYRKTYVFADGVLSLGTIVIQCDPTQNDQSSYIRISINPAKVEAKELAIFINKIVPGGFKRVVNEAWITRVDIAIDVPNIEINDLVVFPGKARKSKQYYNSGKLESQYFGDIKSPLHFVLYDKLAQLKCKYKQDNLIELIGHNKPITSVTRIEARIRPKSKTLLLKDLINIKNPFNNFCISLYANIKTTNQILRMALEILNLSDFKRARHYLTEYQNKQFTKILKSNMCYWWNCDKIWSTWSYQVDKVLNPKN